MFNAFKADSTMTIISAACAKPLIEKLLLIDKNDEPKLEFEIGYKKYPGHAEINRDKKNYQTFTEAQAIKLRDFLNKNNIKCQVEESQVTHYSAIAASNGVRGGLIACGLKKIITFPELKTKEELIAKVNALYPNPQPVQNRARNQ